MKRNQKQRIFHTVPICFFYFIQHEHVALKGCLFGWTLFEHTFYVKEMLLIMLLSGVDFYWGNLKRTTIPNTP